MVNLQFVVCFLSLLYSVLGGCHWFLSNQHLRSQLSPPKHWHHQYAARSSSGCLSTFLRYSPTRTQSDICRLVSFIRFHMWDVLGLPVYCPLSPSNPRTCSPQLYQPQHIRSSIQRGEEAGLVFSHSLGTRDAIDNRCFKSSPSRDYPWRPVYVDPGPVSWPFIPWFPTTSARQHHQPCCLVICRVVQSLA